MSPVSPPPSLNSQTRSVPPSSQVAKPAPSQVAKSAPPLPQVTKSAPPQAQTNSVPPPSQSIKPTPNQAPSKSVPPPSQEAKPAPNQAQANSIVPVSENKKNVKAVQKQAAPQPPPNVPKQAAPQPSSSMQKAALTQPQSSTQKQAAPQPPSSVQGKSTVKPKEKEMPAQQKTLQKIQQTLQKIHQNESNTLSPKQTLKNIVDVTPKTNNEVSSVKSTQKKDLLEEEDRQKKTPIVEENSKTASVKKAAEKYETQTAVQGNNSPESNLHLRIRSKSIGNNRKELFEDAKENKEATTNLPWAARTPQLKKKTGFKDKNFALQMSKSSDSITAAKLLAKARSENNANSGGLRINKNFSKSIEQQIDVYSKTKEEIRMILTLAKSGSVNDRVNLFSNMVNKRPPSVDPDEKAESIRREIEEARANAQETVSDTEIEFQEPIESKVKPLKIRMKPKLLGNSNSPIDNSLRINQSRNDISKERRPSIEELPSLKSKLSSYQAATEEVTRPQQTEQKIKPILVKKSDNERSRSPRKKTPKLVSDHYLNPNQEPFQIYAQSATDMSATEDEFETERNRKISVPAKLSSQPPGPGFLQVPQRAQADTFTTGPRTMLGLVKSKSFASPGQFECSIDNDSITSKKQTMMSFFSNEPQPKSIMKKQPLRRSSLTSITDEVICDEDLEDIDEEFENLLTQTFEKESAKNSRSSSHAGLTGFPQASGKLRGEGGGGGGRFTNKHSAALQKSKSFSATSQPGHFTQEYSDTKELPSSSDIIMNKKIREGFDPVAALPSSSQQRGAGGQQARSPPPMYNSPSPTPSEYDTADPDTYD